MPSKNIPSDEIVFYFKNLKTIKSYQITTKKPELFFSLRLLIFVVDAVVLMFRGNCRRRSSIYYFALTTLIVR